MSEICGMIPFHNSDKPDQVYRLWTSLFIHAGFVNRNSFSLQQHFGLLVWAPLSAVRDF